MRNKQAIELAHFSPTNLCLRTSSTRQGADICPLALVASRLGEFGEALELIPLSLERLHESLSGLADACVRAKGTHSKGQKATSGVVGRG